MLVLPPRHSEESMSTRPRRERSSLEAPLEAVSAEQGLQRARRIYRDISEQLFALCYSIQVSGELPDPVLLTEMLLQYRYAVALIEALHLQFTCEQDEGTLVGTPVPHT